MAGQRSKSSVEVQAAPELVFEWLVDPGKTEEWLQTSTSWYPADRTELRVGYRASQSMELPQMDGSIEAVETQIEVTAYDPPWEFASVNRNPLTETSAGYRLAEAEMGTRLEAWMETRYLGHYAGIMEMPAAAEQAKRMQDEGLGQSLERLKSLVETESVST